MVVVAKIVAGFVCLVSPVAAIVVNKPNDAPAPTEEESAPVDRCGVPVPTKDPPEYPIFLFSSKNKPKDVMKKIKLPEPLVSPLLRDAQSSELILGEINISVSEKLKPTAAKNPNKRLLSFHYARTGAHFARRFTDALASFSNFSGVCDYSTATYSNVVKLDKGSSIGSFWKTPIEIPESTVVRIGSASPKWGKPKLTRSAHWFRDPVDLIISSYLTHKTPSSAHEWEKVVGRCTVCDVHSMKAIFEVCDYKCNYLQLLRSVDEYTGVGLETLNQRLTINHMVGNLMRWANDPTVLHLTVGHLKTNYNATIQCMMRFYGMPLKAKGGAFLEQVQDLNIHKLSADEPGYPNRHITDGKENTTNIREWLEGHPVWGLEFAALKDIEIELFARQNRMYGCPIPQGFEAKSDIQDVEEGEEADSSEARTVSDKLKASATDAEVEEEDKVEVEELLRGKTQEKDKQQEDAMEVQAQAVEDALVVAVAEAKVNEAKQVDVTKKGDKPEEIVPKETMKKAETVPANVEKAEAPKKATKTEALAPKGRNYIRKDERPKGVTSDSFAFDNAIDSLHGRSEWAGKQFIEHEPWAAKH